MHKSADGDIVVPQRNLSVVGTSSWVVEDPDDLTARVMRCVDVGLWTLGTLTIAYGFVLLITLALR